MAREQATRRARPGDLVKVASATNEAEAELIQGFLREEGITSVLRRTPGFDVPDFLAAGPRDVLVAADQVGLARDALPQESDPGPAPPDNGATRGAPRVRAGILIAVALVAAAVCVGLEVWI